MATKIKTSLTMSEREYMELLLERLVTLTERLGAVGDRFDHALGPPPRPSLTVVRQDDRSTGLPGQPLARRR